MSNNTSSDQLPKFCVFCGKKPEEKTKEHIIPQWLIKLTGDPNREITFGVGTKRTFGKREFELRKYAFSSLQFPACQKCNSEFSKLEDEVKIIIEKVLSKEFLANTELSRLLDWFDKVRIGLWLGNLLLEREIPPVHPNFYIKDRIAEKDRCIILYEINDDQKGIQFGGTHLPAFSFTPSCFSLCINNFYFLNISADFLFSRNIGFPFPTRKTFRGQDKRTIMAMSPGLNKTKLPLLKYRLLQPSIEIYQPMIFSKLCEKQTDLLELYNCDYVKKNCLDFSNGVGAIFYMDSNVLVKLDEDHEICISGNGIVYNREFLLPKISKHVIDIQSLLTKDFPSVELLPLEQRKSARSTKNTILKLQKAYRGLIRNGS